MHLFFRPVVVYACSCFLVVSVLFGCSSDPAQKKVTHLKKAMVYLEDSKEQEAIIELRNAVQIDPKYAEARYQLGLLYLNRGEPNLAFEELQQAASLDPANFDAKIKTAELYLLADQKEASRKLLNEILAKDADNKDALALLANVELFEGNHEAALAGIDRALAKTPEDDRLWGVKGRVLSAMQRFPEAEQAFLKALELDRNEATNYSLLASFYIERQQPYKAREILEKMAGAFPDSPQPYLQMASIDLAHNNVAAAEQHLQQAVQADPKNSRLKLSLAEFYTRQHKPDQAEQQYKEAIDTAEVKEDVQAQLADFYFDHGRFEEARHLMGQILAKQEKNAGANLVQAKFYTREDKNPEALSIINGLIRDYPKWDKPYLVKAVAHSNQMDRRQAKEALLEAIKLNPGFARARSLLAALSLQEGEFETAKKEAATALKINPNDFRSALTLAESMFATRDYGTAEKMFADLHNKLPENVDVLGGLGLTYLAMGQHEKAKQTFTKLLTIQPDNAKGLTFLLQIAQTEGAKQEDLLKMAQAQIAKAPQSGGLQILLGNLYLSADQPEKALAAYQKAQELDPENPLSYTMSAMVLAKQGKTDQAIAEYKDLLRKHPRSVNAHMGLGSLYEQTAEHGLARETYAHILTIKPDFAPAANNLAWLIAESENPDLGEALRLAMLAKQQQPDDAYIIDTLGWVHYKRGSYTLARNEFAQAVQKQDDLPVLRYHLALALYGEGKKQEAIQELTRALAQKNAFEERDEAAAVLKKWQDEQ